MTVFTVFCAGFAAAIVLLTFVRTRDAYPSLPDRVPVRIGPGGVIDAFGPRRMIWLGVVIQLIVGCIITFAGAAIAMNLPHTHGRLSGLSLTAVFIMGLLWRIQTLVLEAARTGARSVPMQSFWVFFGVAVAGIAGSVFL